MSVRFMLVFALLFAISCLRVTTQGHADEVTTQSSLLGEDADITQKAVNTFQRRETADGVYRHGTQSSESNIASSARFDRGTNEHSPSSPVEPHTKDPNPDDGFQIEVNDFRDGDMTAQNEDGQLSHTGNHVTDFILAHKQTPVMKFSGRVKKLSKVPMFESVKKHPAIRWSPPKRKVSKQLAAQVFSKAKAAENADGRKPKFYRKQCSYTVESFQKQEEALKEQTNSQIAQLRKEIKDLREKVTRRVAFTVRFSKNPVTVQKNGIYVFDHVVTNIGNAYSNKTGIFTAPVSGLYVLHVNFMSTNNKPGAGLVIQKNGENLGYLWGAGSASADSQSSTTVTTFMQRGQQAWVTHGWGSTAIRGNEWSAFSGFLANPQ